MGRQFFGTDGIRGKVGDYPITPEFMLKLGWAAGKVFARGSQDRQLILIGKDTRISGYMFESALQAGLIAAGVDVGLLGPMPTPAIAYLTRTFQAKAGIVISASHNPFEDNGIKFFCGRGMKLPDAVEEDIEYYLQREMDSVSSAALGKAKRIADAAGRYIEYCKSTVPVGFHLRGLKIAVDCANGATYDVAPNVFRELGAEVVTLGTEPNGLNINHDCGSTQPEALQHRVISAEADLGIALDGDGDRVLFVDHQGELVDGDELLYIIAQHRQRHGGGCNGVVGTLMSNFGFEQALAELKIPFCRAKVGDRYVMEQLAARNWMLGGEGSGHIVCRDITTTGDGIIAALQVLQALLASGQSLHDLKRGMSKLPQTLINVRLPQRMPLDDNRAVSDAVAATEQRLNGRGRVLLRLSGTEPLVRVMVEGEDPQLVGDLARDLASRVEQALA